MYFMSIFASDSCLFQKPSAHSFATFVKVPGDASQKAAQIVTISWFPATDVVRLVAPPEPGENRDLLRSLERARRKGIRICQWGPFQIEPELFERASRHLALLESGCVQWQAHDIRGRRVGAVFNCVHAISDLDCDLGRLKTGLHCGERASRILVRHFERWIIDPCTVHPQINVVLGIADYPYPICPKPFPSK